MSGKSDEKSMIDVMMMVSKTSPSMLAFSQSSKKEKVKAVDGDVLKAIKDACDIAEISITTVTGKVTCTQAGGKDDFLYMVDNGGTKVKASGLTALQKTDIEMTNQNKFKKCNKTDDKLCPGADIVGKEWKLTSGSNEVGEASESPYKEKSCMVCLQGGAIYFVSSGQVLGDFESELGDKEFENDLRQKGFTEGYIKYLMILHEKYPKWNFEAVLTNIDYVEFLNYQINNATKCADISNYPIYCTNNKFKGEKSPIYYVANEAAIRFFSHPLSMLQTNQGNYENALQFLKADQKLPKTYSDDVVNSILKGKDIKIVNAIKNSNLSINPIFMASIYDIENGPSGEIYNGKTVYNLFNIGAYTGREDSKKYAYENKWFTVEDCIQGSSEEFQNFIDRGQNTLYAMDWDFQSYGQNGNVNQYATLVNDAEDKAIKLYKSGNINFDLNQEFVFSIPVYDNIPFYNGEENLAFPDPNK